MRRTSFILLLLCMTVFFVACNDTDKAEEKDKEQDTVIPVEVAAVDEGNFNVKKSVYGRTAPSKQSPVMLQEAGEIKELKVKNGDQVEEDDHVATVKTPMGNRNIYAPKDGEVAKLAVQEGDMQSNEDPLLIIMDTEKLHAAFDLTSSVQGLFETDDDATIYINDKKYKGKVLSVDSLPNDSGQYAMKVEVTNDKDILPGTAANLEVSETRVKDTIVVPTDAIIRETDDTFVFIADGDKAKKVEVEVEETQTDKSAVKGDLKKGDKVIVKGQFTLSDGTEIDIKEGNEE